MSLHIVTQIKKDVEQAKLRQYSISKEKKQIKYFSLYLKQIVKIQRTFRGYLARKTRNLQKQLSQELSKKELLHFKANALATQLDNLKQQERKIKNSDLSKMIQQQKQNNSQNIRQTIRNVVNSADNYAKNAAIAKISLSFLQSVKKQEKLIEAEVKQLQLQKQCSNQRIMGWHNRLNQIRAKIIQETSARNRLLKQLQEIYTIQE